MGKIDGVIITPLRRVYNPKGDVYHGMKKSDDGYNGFGEAYFSTVSKGIVKGWKKHTRMTMNLISVSGRIRFTLFDDREESGSRGEKFIIELSKENYQRLTVPPMVWMAFEGVEDENMLLNIADLEHDPSEAVNIEITEIEY